MRRFNLCTGKIMYIMIEFYLHHKAFLINGKGGLDISCRIKITTNSYTARRHAFPVVISCEMPITKSPSDLSEHSCACPHVRKERGRLPLGRPCSSCRIQELNSSSIYVLCIWPIYHLHHSGMAFMSDRSSVMKTHGFATCIDFTMKEMLKIDAGLSL